MNNIWNKMKKSGQKTKIRGEIALMEREINGRKKTFGIELYDMMTNDKNKLLGVAAGTLFKGHQMELKEPFERARDDIAGIQARKDVKQKDLDVLEVKGASTMPDATLEQKMNKAGRAISNGASGTKLRGQMALLDREMKIRKEEFGIEVFDLSQGSKKNESGDSILSGLSEQEHDIQSCIDKAKEDVAAIHDRIKSKESEMSTLDEEMAPLASS